MVSCREEENRRSARVLSAVTRARGDTTYALSASSRTGKGADQEIFRSQTAEGDSQTDEASGADEWRYGKTSQVSWET